MFTGREGLLLGKLGILGSFVDWTMAERVSMVPGGPTGRTNVFAEDRTDDLAAVVLQNVGGVEFPSLPILLAQSTGLFVYGKHGSSRVDQAAAHHSLILQILERRHKVKDVGF